MNRRGFLARMAGAIAAAAVTCNFVREEEIVPDVSGARFNPTNYIGEWKWIQFPPSPEGTGYFREVMKPGSP